MKLQRLLLRYYPPGMYIYNKSTIAVKWICKSCHYWCCGLALYGMGSHACTADPCSSTCVAGIVMHDFIHVKKKGVRMGYMMGVHEVLSELTILIATVIMVACTSMSAGQCDWRMRIAMGKFEQTELWSVNIRHRENFWTFSRSEDR